MGAPMGNDNAKGPHKKKGTSKAPKKINWDKYKKAAQKKHSQSFYEKRADRLAKTRKR